MPRLRPESRREFNDTHRRGARSVGNILYYKPSEVREPKGNAPWSGWVPGAWWAVGVAGVGF